MDMTQLPADKARCNGVESDAKGWLVEYDTPEGGRNYYGAFATKKDVERWLFANNQLRNVTIRRCEANIFHTWW